MGQTKSRVTRRTLLGMTTAALLASCSAEQSSPVSIDGDWGDDRRYPELGGAHAEYLTALDGTCSFNTMTGVMGIDANNAAQTIIIGRRAVDNAILVNGATCGSPAATSSTLKILNLNTGMTGDQVVILDFINGLFASGTATARGINVDLGAGTDSLRIRGQRTADTITFGASGIGTAVDANRDIDIANVESYNVSLGSGADVFSANGGAGGAGAAFGTAVTVFGGADADTLTGSTAADTLNGGDGNDTIRGGDGDDTLNGDEGNDTFDEGSASNGDDVFDGGNGTDVVSYASRTNAVTVTVNDSMMDDGESGEADDVGATVETVTGGGGDDTLTGSSGAQTLNGGAGADTLSGGDGADVLNGDAGDDTFDEGSASNGGDTFNGGAGTDLLDYSARTAALTVTMDGVAANDGESMEADNVKADVESIIGGTVNDNITGNALANVIDGGDGDDILSGGLGDDTFDEGSADNGSDQFVGGGGTDKVDYSARTAALTVTMDGTAADDGLSGEGDDVENDVESLVGGTAADDITGNALNNIIDGAGAGDTIAGGAGDDTLDGSAGDDTIDGEAGDDTLDGGAGDNDLTCGAGDDIAYNEGMGTRAADCEL